jgi:hypothetical protein
MRPVGGISGSSAIRIGTSPRGERTASPESSAEIGAADQARALVPLTPNASQETSSQRPSADFLAHLIATAGQMPQTRERRRVDPQDAIAAYASTAADQNAPARQKFSRST